MKHVVLAAAITLTQPGCIGCETGSGEATGYVTSVEKDGFVWKTWTVEWKSDTESSHVNCLCVTDDEELIRALKDAGRTRIRARISYIALPFNEWPWRCHTLTESARITAVEPAVLQEGGNPQ